jgi:hypothetical protein
MRLQKAFTILVLLGLLFIPLSGTMSHQTAMAEDTNPPTTDDGSRLDQDVVEDGLVQQPPESPTGGDIENKSYMTGTDPSQGLEKSHSVEVILPASVPPPEGTVTASGPYQARSEGSYSIIQTVNLAPGPDVLLLEADDDTISASPILSLLQAYGDLGSVDMFDAHSATPTLGELLPYDIVVTWSNTAYADPIAIGNVLADYVDTGGKVINLNFSMDLGFAGLQGRFMTGNYSAMKGTSLNFLTDCLGSYDPSHPIMSGITNVCDYYRITGTTLTPGSSSIAQYSDGLLFVAAKNNRSVVSINGYVGIYFQWTGQMPDLLHNAILWLTSPEGCNTVLWNNGPMVTQIGGGYSSSNASALQTALGMGTYGFGHQFSVGYRMADDFMITNPAGWDIEQLTFFAYQTDAYAYPPVSTITGIYYQIWDGPPDDPGSSVIFGDLTTNRLMDTSWTHIYRVLDTTLTDTTRPIMANVASAGLHLPPGTYWLDWTTDGSGASGPWAPPITILSETTTGNAMQYTTVWAPANDTSLVTQQGMPFLVQGCREAGKWKQITSNPVPLMDNILAAYSGKVWSITGYGVTGVSNFDPVTKLWSTVAASAPPFGVNYARSGCQVGNKVYMYGDTTTVGFTGLWSYNMATNVWTQETPTGTPPAQTGIWSPSWVLDTATSHCYMTGGATAPGGGNLSTVYVYNAAANQWLAPLPIFTNVRDFHAAFIFIRPIDSHKLLCVAGGIDASNVAWSSTQCYDFNTASWQAENADLGALPFDWWGMGYTQSPTVNGNKLWFVNGIDAALGLNNQNWYYSVASHSWVNTGPLESGNFYRTSAVTLNGTIYHIGGSTGGFSASGLSDKYVTYLIYLPLTIK